MLSKFVCAAVLASGAIVQAHSINTRDTSQYASARDSQYGAPQAPASSYDAPAPSYSAPAPSYSAPAPSYEAPASSYESPAPSYSAPSPSYSSPSTGYGEEAGIDLTSIIIPLLALIGLSLLFPTFVTLTTVRKKREAGEESAANPMNEIAERVNDIYYSVVESEECMQRIACEVGALAEDFGLKERTITSLAEPFVPSKYKSYYKQFSAGKNCQKIKCGKLSL